MHWRQPRDALASAATSAAPPAVAVAYGKPKKPREVLTDWLLIAPPDR